MLTTLHDNLVASLDFGSDTELLDALEDGSFKTELVRAIDSLPEYAQRLMGMIYQQELNLREICAVMGTNESHISQLHGQTLTQLSNCMKVW